MAAFSSVVSVATATYPSTPQIEIAFFQPKKLVAQNFDAAAIVYVSLDGINDHAALIADVKSPMSLFQWDYQMPQKVWIRTAAAVATQVQVIAEG